MVKIYRQGDVLLREIRKPKLNNYKSKKDNVVLALGEATGHHHTIDEDVEIYWNENDDIEKFALDGTSSQPIFVNIVKETSLKHQEHAPIKIDQGWYEVIRQREYHPERIRRVQD